MLLCVIVFIQLTWPFVGGHSRFICPRPQTSRSDIYMQLPNHTLDGPCGLGDTINFYTEYMEVSPGPFTVRFEETVLHKDSPFQISLHEFDDYSNDSKTCVLLDHIPHNNNSTISKACKMNKYPIGHCDGSMYYITVNIPDITCDKCYLKLTHVEIHTATDPSCGIGNDTCRNYISCASIKIRSTAAGKQRNLSFCEKYVNNLMGPWPYRPQEYYTTAFIIASKVLNATGKFDEFGRSLKLDIPSHVFSTPIERVEILHEVDDGNTTTFETLFTKNITKKQSTDGVRITVTWNGLDESATKKLQSEILILKLLSSEESVNGTIQFSHELFGVGHYEGGGHALYSYQGWLSGSEFVGPEAVYPAGVTPFGPCAEVTNNYIAFIHPDNDLNVVHGVMGMSFVDERVHVTVAVTGLKNNITSIDVTGPSLAGAPPLKIPVTTTGVIHLTLNASAQIHDSGSLKFLNKVTVCTEDPAEKIDIELEEGMYALITDDRRLYGVGLFQITKGRWLKYEVVLKDIQGHISYATLSGPKHWGLTSPVMYKLTEDVILKENGDTLIEGSIKGLSSDFLLALWKGLVTLNIKTHTNQSENLMTGKLSSPGIWYCSDIKGAPCSSVNLVPEGLVVDQGAEVVPASGVGSIVLDRANVLQYSILVENSQVSITKVMHAEIVHGSKILLPIQLHPSDNFHKVFEVHSVHPQPSFEMIAALSTGKVQLRVLEVDGRKGKLTGTLPQITRDICTDSQNFMVGDGHGYWSMEAAPIGGLYTLKGDQLVFTYSGNDSVHLMASKEHLNECDFENATQIGAPPLKPGLMSVDYRLKETGQLYFTSQANCNSTPPLKLVVNVLHSVPKTTDDVDDCGTSMYEMWRKQELGKFTSPNPAGAAVGGVIAGMVLMVIFIIWDKRIHDKKSGDVSMFERF